jgi:hypothetical protein
MARAVHEGQLEVLDAVTDAFEDPAPATLRALLIEAANADLERGGYPFEFYQSGPRVYVREVE